jgi:hypothetical protein
MTDNLWFFANSLGEFFLIFEITGIDGSLILIFVFFCPSFKGIVETDDSTILI